MNRVLSYPRMIMIYFMQLCYNNGQVHDELEVEDNTDTGVEVRRQAKKLAQDPTFEQDYVFVIDMDGQAIGKFRSGE